MNLPKTLRRPSASAAAAWFLFFLSLLPILYLGLHNHATGDDYWYGVHTYRGLVEGGLIGALKGSLRTVSEFYENWQGTWFTMFLFTLSPHHFHENGYVLTVFISLGLLIGSFTCLSRYYLVKMLDFRADAVIVCSVLCLAIQYIPRTTSGIFWFNGVMHYSVPLFLAVLAVIHSHRFVQYGRWKDYAVLFISFTLLGGGSYLAPVAATLAVCLILASRIRIRTFDLRNRKLSFAYDWKNLWILAAFTAELVGLVISFLAPGNRVRGGEEFGADLKWGLQCVYYAIDRGIYLGEDYFLKNPVTTVVYILLAVLIWSEMWRNIGRDFRFRFPLLFVVCMNGIYWASYVPEIYARSDVSGGVPNTYFHIFLIITLANMIYVTGWLQRRLVRYWHRKAERAGLTYEETAAKSIWGPERFKKRLMIPAMAVGLALLPAAVHYSGLTTTDGYCMEYITSGKMAQYVKVRKEQYRLLHDSTEADVIVPEVCGDQYPLCHMPLPDDNQKAYYNKNSINIRQVD